MPPALQIRLRLSFRRIKSFDPRTIRCRRQFVRYYLNHGLVCVKKGCSSKSLLCTRKMYSTIVSSLRNYKAFTNASYIRVSLCKPYRKYVCMIYVYMHKLKNYKNHKKCTGIKIQTIRRSITHHSF